MYSKQTLLHTYFFPLLIGLLGTLCAQETALSMPMPFAYAGGSIGITTSNLPDKDLIANSELLQDTFLTKLAEQPYFPLEGVENRAILQNNSLHPLAWSFHVGIQFPQTNQLSLGWELGYHGVSPFRYRIENSAYVIENTAVDTSFRDVRLEPIVYLLALARYQLTNRFYMFGGAGPAWIRTKVKEDCITSSFAQIERSKSTNLVSDIGQNIIVQRQSKSFNNIEPEITVGMGWRLTEHLAFYTRFSHIVGSSESHYDDHEILNLPGTSPSVSIVTAGFDVLF